GVRLEQHAEPVGALGGHLPDRRVEPPTGEERDVVAADLGGELDEEILLAREVVEDRPAREAGLRLEPGDRGAVVAPAREGAARAIGCFAGPYCSSARVVILEVVREDERLVAQANAILAGGQQVTQIAGPVLAGALIAATSPATVLVVDGGTYLFSFLTIALF